MKKYYNITSIAPIIVRTIFNKKELAFNQDALPIEGITDLSMLADCASAVKKHAFGENSVDYIKLADHRVVISAEPATKSDINNDAEGRLTLENEFRNCGDDDPDSSTQLWLIKFRETIDEDQLSKLPRTKVDAIRALDKMYYDACHEYGIKRDRHQSIIREYVRRYIKTKLGR